MEAAIATIGRVTGLPFVVGIQPYATLLAFGLLRRAGLVTDPLFLQDQFAVFENTYFLSTVAVLFLIEATADKIPGADHVSDVLHSVLKPLAGAYLGFLAVSAVNVGESLGIAALSAAVVGGGSLSLATHSTKAGGRLASSHLTLGLGNSVLSLVEDAFAVGATVLLTRYPALLGGFVIIFSLLLIWIAPKAWRAGKSGMANVRQKTRRMSNWVRSLPKT